MRMTCKDWVDECINNFNNPPHVIAEMLDAMHGTLVPDAWIDEALKYLNKQYPITKTPVKLSTSWGYILTLKWSAVNGLNNRPTVLEIAEVFKSRAEAMTWARSNAHGWVSAQVRRR